MYTLTKTDGKIILQLYQHENTARAVNYDFTARTLRKTVLVSKELPGYHGRIYLHAQGEKEQYAFYYGFEEQERIPLALSVDATLLSTTRAGGFVGAYIGLYASSNGEASANHADFHWFEYSPAEGN